jgi:hypothetical protein
MINIWIYDIEVYTNLFMATFLNTESLERKVFTAHIFRHKDNVIVKEGMNFTTELKKFLSDGEAYFVGYNNTSYDDQILEYIFQYDYKMKNMSLAHVLFSIHKLSQMIINENFKGYMYSNNFRSFDMMNIPGGSGLRKSLKLVACNLKWPIIQDLPIPFNAIVKSSELPEMKLYNYNDVAITHRMFEVYTDKIALRADISKQYDMYLMNETESGIANKLFEKFYLEDGKETIEKIKADRHFPKSIMLKDVILPIVKFKSPELIELLDKLKKVSVDTTADKITIGKDITVVLDGTEYQLGVGGLHSVDKGAIFESNNEEDIVDADVSSHYPITIINWLFKPRQLLDKFFTILKDIIAKRLNAKKNKQKNIADTFKIVVNSVFGKMGFKPSWLYDPKAMLQTTVNGQLLLLVLIDRLILSGFKVISANTDGIITIVPKKMAKMYLKICEEWSKEMKYELEYTKYSKYIRRDVNNYIAIPANYKSEKEIKLKGTFSKELYKDLAKGYNKPIVAIAVYNYFVHNTPIEYTIRNHQDILDFCIAKKSDKKYGIYYIIIKGTAFIKETLQLTNRYYISKGGGKLIKQEANKRTWIEFESGYNVRILNNLPTSKGKYILNPKSYDINYQYYIRETRKIIKGVEPSNQLIITL